MSRLFGKAAHTAYIVPDVDFEIERLSRIGIGPIFVMRKIRPPAYYRGERHDPLISVAFVYTGEHFLEFLQQHDDTPSAAREFLDRVPVGGFHHIAYFSDDFDATLAEVGKATGQTFDMVQQYIGEDGLPFEIYVQPAGKRTDYLVQLVHRGPLEVMYNLMREAAYDWDGSKPIREASELLPEDARSPKDASAG